MVRTEVMRRTNAALLPRNLRRWPPPPVGARAQPEREASEGGFWKAIAALLAAALAAVAVQAHAQLGAASASSAQLEALQTRLAKLEARSASPSTPGLGELALAARVQKVEGQLAALDEASDWEEAARLGIARALASRPSPLAPGVEAHLAAAIVREARQAGLDPLLVTAVMQQESGFNPAAVSRVGAVGLMQLMPATAQWLQQKSGAPAQPGHLLEVEQNLHLGCQYLAALIRQFGSEDRALVAYNMGPAAARAALRGPRARELLAGYPRSVQAIRARLAAGQRPASDGRGVLAAVESVERSTHRR